jgi:DNA-binding response OmpR family regulator
MRGLIATTHRLAGLAAGRTTMGTASFMKAAELELDPTQRTVKRNGRIITLTPREFGLFELLVRYRGQVVSRALIWEHLYDEEPNYTSNVIDVLIRYLRKKIDGGFDSPLILTRRGQGYMLRGIVVA